MKALDLLGELFKDNKIKQNAKLINPKELPAWISRSVHIYSISLREAVSLYLVKPKKDLSFSQLTNIFNQVEKQLGNIVLLIADEINPKYRSLFVKNQIPFIYKNKSLFAPSLGIKLFNYKTSKPVEGKVLDEAINPLELKLLAGFLTGFMAEEEFNLKQLEKFLEQNKYKCSKTKLSITINHLIDLDYMDVKGSGPKRIIMFKNRNEIWESLKNAPVKPFFKMIEGYSFDPKQDYVFSGETSLAHYSNLAEPKIRHVAINKKEFKEIKNIGILGQSQLTYEVFKEPPNLFAKDNSYLNPIELYFMLRKDQDERIQMALEQMLSEFGLQI